MNKLTVVLLAVFVAIMIVSGLASYVLLDRLSSPNVNTSAQRPAAPATSPSAEKGSQTAPETENNRSRSILADIFGIEQSGSTTSENASWAVTAVRSTFRFSLAALLAGILAFRPRRGVPVNQRNPYVAQTQILLSVVAAAMMMIVGDSAARAFGIFAAASLVNFRTNIRDPKEITVLLICLGVGLASGVGRGELAVMLSLFVLLTLWILEYFETAQVFRSMELCVETRNMKRTHDVLKQIFARHKLNFELRELNREDEDDPTGKVVYCVSLRSAANTDLLSEELISADPQNIDSVEWSQKKSTTYIYN